MATDTATFSSKPIAYSAPAKWLHWLMALIILAMIPAGIIMRLLPEGPLQDQLYASHEAFGFIAMVLVIIRLAVRSKFPPPSPAASLSRLERIVSVSTHHLLYVMMCVMPVLGWLAISAYGTRISLFGLVALPALLPKNEPLSAILFTFHRIGGLLTAGLVVAHLSGALRHWLIKRDNVAQRMLPTLR